MFNRLIFVVVCFVINLFSLNGNTAKVFKSNIVVKDASYTCYTTAMGKGRGVLFKLTLQNLGNKSVIIDSFYIANSAQLFTVKKHKNTYYVEVNMLKNIPNPVIQNEEKNEDKDIIIDKVINEHHFYPSWLLVRINGKKNKILITQFKEIKTNY